jgi:hypothetical protein
MPSFSRSPHKAPTGRQVNRKENRNNQPSPRGGGTLKDTPYNLYTTQYLIRQKIFAYSRKHKKSPARAELFFIQRGLQAI